MKIVAVETSSTRGSVSIYDTSEAKPLAESFWLRDKSHSEILIDEYLRLLSSIKLDPSQVSAYAVGQGPGSFTGIRVGINFVRSMAFSFKKPVYVIDSLRLLAEEGLRSEKLPTLCLINAFRNLIYCAGYRKGPAGIEAWLPPQVLSAEELDSRINENVQCLGNGYEAYSEQFSTGLKSYLTPPSSEQLFPRAESLSALISQDHSPALELPWREVKPLYVRASEAEEKLGRN